LKLAGLVLAAVMVAMAIAGCGSPVSTNNVVYERPAGPADKLEIVMFHFTQR